MSLSTIIRRRLAVALASKAAADTIADAIDASGKQAANVAAIGTTTNVRVDSLANLGADTEARLDVIEGKIDAILVALKGAGFMIAD